MNLKNKTVIITGASRGLGREIAAQLAKEKCNVVVVSRTKPDIVKCINRADGVAVWAKADEIGRAHV